MALRVKAVERNIKFTKNENDPWRYVMAPELYTALMSRSYDAAVIRQDMKNRFSPEKIAKQYCCLYGELSKRMELG